MRFPLMDLTLRETPMQYWPAHQRARLNMFRNEPLTDEQFAQISGSYAGLDIGDICNSVRECTMVKVWKTIGEPLLPGWRICFFYHPKRLGYCCASTRTIGLCNELMTLPLGCLLETVRHEVAHALTAFDSEGDLLPWYGHGDDWAEMCIALGGIGTTKMNVSHFQDSYIYIE